MCWLCYVLDKVENKFAEVHAFVFFSRPLCVSSLCVCTSRDLWSRLWLMMAALWLPIVSDIWGSGDGDHRVTDQLRLECRDKSTKITGKRGKHQLWKHPCIIQKHHWTIPVRLLYEDCLFSPLSVCVWSSGCFSPNGELSLNGNSVMAVTRCQNQFFAK